ncbi:transcriptional repressor LexA [Sandaracinobacteroides sp. A072]|uniref:transcriptional repressor LexA n=1 Tax=Sandaracinobacteroides sp. A072 TaxID=3461146 RepID=UPI0040427403
MLTAKQHELLQFIQSRLAETGVSPSFEEMKEALDLKSKSGVHRLIRALEERQFLRRLPNRARALEVLRMPGDALPGDRRGGVTDIASARARRAARQPAASAPALSVPLVGRIAAGLPIEAVEDHEQLAVPTALLGPGEHYALQVTGDSMIEAGIFDGDFALIRRCEDAQDGDIVVALIDNNEATLKYFHRDKGMIRLDPANAAHDPQVYLPSRVRIQGRLAGLLRRY